jgi:hypothetical protein
VDHPLPWLRYVNASDLDDDAIDFDEMNVESPVGEHLGDVDGFIVDADTTRPYYVVVGAGGWFKSKHFLLPVGHARLDADREVLVTDVPKNRVEKFPGFDRDTFETLTEKDLKHLNDETCSACAIDGVSVVYSAAEPYRAAWDRPDYRYPDWWRANPTQPTRAGEAAITSGVASRPSSAAGETSRPSRASERVVARESNEADPSPHFGGRAQPGDVIGVETGGERTHVGETADDENKRRRDAEQHVRKTTSRE